jgi:SAM-dependent methyltransferase
MIEHAQLQPGQQVVELAAGPGDTGFLAAEVIRPGGRLISSDGTEAMLEVARARAEQLGVDNVEFKQLQLEWIDLPTASADAILCRWGVMLSLDPEAALREMRRVLRPGGRVALAVWDEAARNPWATVPNGVFVERGLIPPPQPDAPGPFALGAPGRLQELLESAGFVEVVVEPVEVGRTFADADEFLAESLDLSAMLSEALEASAEDERAAIRAAVAERLAPFVGADGSTHVPGRSLVAAASA